MAQVSAFGFGGTDHLNSLFELGMNDLYSKQSFNWNGRDMRRQLAYQKKLIEWQNEQTKGMSIWSAANMPRYTMQGLKAAGLNPLLAAGGNTNVAPVVASSAANVPYSESYTDKGFDASTHGPSAGDAAALFSGNAFASAKALKESNRATIAEQKARREFFESPEGKKAVLDKLRMDYGPQSPMQAATLGVHSAKSVALPNESPANEGTNNQLVAWIKDNARAFDRWFWGKDDPQYRTYDGSRKRRTYNRNDNSRDNRRYNINFNFGSSARRSYDSGSNTNRPVWYNPDLKR